MQFRIRSPVRVAMFAALALAFAAYFMATPTDALAPAPNGPDQVITTAQMTHDPGITALVVLSASTANTANNNLQTADISRTILSSGADSAVGAIIARHTTSAATSTTFVASVVDSMANTLVTTPLAAAIGDCNSANRLETGRGNAPTVGDVAQKNDNLVSFAFVQNAATQQTAAINNTGDSVDNYPNPFNAFETPDVSTTSATAMLGKNTSLATSAASGHLVQGADVLKLPVLNLHGTVYAFASNVLAIGVVLDTGERSAPKLAA